MKIVIDPFKKESVDAAIKQLDQYVKDFATKEKLFTERLAEIGVSVARTGFSMADYDGVNDVSVSLAKTASGVAVIAAGSTVGFIEFGTGVRYPEWSNPGVEYSPPGRGTYGKGRGKNPRGWYFKQGEGAAARHTYGNPPAEAMLAARDEMISRVTQIAREVWR